MKIPFVPVDNIYPKDRLNNIAMQSKAKFIYDTQSNDFFKFQDLEEPLIEKDIAYIIFTSGTTGNPKGVQIGREAVENLIKWMKLQLNLTDSAIFMNQAPFCFDLSMYEVFGNLAYQGCICLGDRESIKNSNQWFDFLNNNRITTWVSTPSFVLQQLFNKNFNEDKFPTIKEFLFCGEKLSKNVVRKIMQRFPNVRILNTYGPTEATVATTYVEITEEMVNSNHDLPVGYAVLNSKITINDGEIVISGCNVMRGYINNESENLKKLKLEGNIRSYCTGDLGFIENDLLYCLGRNDEQIKFNGFRIDLNEIEEKISCLLGFNINDCAVVPLKKSDGSILRLIAFYNTNNRMKIDIDDLKNHLLDILPNYMIPSDFVFIDSIPVTNNHKIDKNRLVDIYLKELVN